MRPAAASRAAALPSPLPGALPACGMSCTSAGPACCPLPRLTPSRLPCPSCFAPPAPHRLPVLLCCSLSCTARGSWRQRRSPLWQLLRTPAAWCHAWGAACRWQLRWVGTDRSGEGGRLGLGLGWDSGCPSLTVVLLLAWPSCGGGSPAATAVPAGLPAIHSPPCLPCADTACRMMSGRSVGRSWTICSWGMQSCGGEAGSGGGGLMLRGCLHGWTRAVAGSGVVLP